MQTKRIFVAFSVSNEAKSELKHVQQDFIGLNKRAHVKWVEPEKMHVTVQFLGDLIRERVEQVKTVLSKIVPKHEKFSYWLERLDAFPNRSNPNIIIAKVGEEHRKSFLLQEAIVSKLKGVGILTDEKPWTPHVTIGRNKKHEKILGFDTIEMEKIVWEISEINLFESKLTSDGPKYILLDSYKLS